MALPFNNVVSDLISGGPNALTSGLSALGILPPTWGIFSRSGAVVVNADTVLSLDFKKDWSVSTYPVERGAFETYDKVENPSETRIGFFSGGSLQNRQALLRSIKAIAPDYNLYDVVTPEETFTSMNVTHVDYRRVDGAAGYVSVVVWLEQIRVTVEAALSTQQPNGAPSTNGGQVQTTTPTTQQQSVLSQWLSTPSSTGGGVAP